MSLQLPAKPQVIQPHQQVLLIILPSELDLAAWREQCGETAPHVEREILPQLEHTPGVWLRSELTYPHLRGFNTDIRRVYIGWREAVRFWHEVSSTALLKTSDLAFMNPVWAGKMRPGQPYLWVFADPQSCPQWSISMGSAAIRLGMLNLTSEYGPVWL